MIYIRVKYSCHLCVFFHYVCLFCSRIVVKIMVFDVTALQVRGLAVLKQVQSTVFYIKKCLYQVRNLTVVMHSFDVFELLILPLY